MGRRPGAKPKIPLNLKELIMKAMELQPGGALKWLHGLAAEDPKWFFEHAVKPMLPRDTGMRVSGTDGGPVVFQVITGMDPELAEPGQENVEEIVDRPVLRISDGSS